MLALVFIWRPEVDLFNTQKRPRVISGSSKALPKISARSTSGSNGVLSIGLLGRRPTKSPLREVTEPSDYFGDLQNVRRSSVDHPLSATSRLTESPPLIDSSSGTASSDLNRRPSANTGFQTGPVIASLLPQAPLPDLRTNNISLSSFDWTRLPISTRTSKAYPVCSKHRLGCHQSGSYRKLEL